MKIETTSIFIPPSRQRKEFDEGKMQDLVASIEEKGLLHAPVIRQEPDGRIFLVAGERRLRAILQLAEFGLGFKYDGELVPAGWCPIVTLGDLNPLDAKEAELEENIRRDDLTWQERVTAEVELMELRTIQAKLRGDPPPKMVDIAEEVTGRTTSKAGNEISQSLTLAKNLHRPEVRQAKTKSEAFKAMLRVEQHERNEKLASGLGADYIVSKHRLVQANCLEWMKEYGEYEVTFDVICSDPPYGMGADEFGDSGGKMGDGAHFYQDDYDSWIPLMREALRLMTSLAKPDAHMYLFCDFERFRELKGWATEYGWKVFRTPLIWFKPSAFRAPWPDKGPQRKYECILYAVRGDLKCVSLAGDVLQFTPDENLGHPAQKPVELIKELLRRSVRPGMNVLDPFCGSGPIFEAANALSVFATGVEQDAAAAGIAAGRLAKLGAR